MKGHQQATSLSVLFDSRTEKNGRSLLHPLRAGQKPKKLTGRKREKGAEGREGRRGLADKSTVFLFILPPLFFFFFLLFFFSRLFSFLTAAMCLISDVICSRPWAGARWRGEGLTVGPPPSSHSNQTQRPANTTQPRARRHILFTGLLFESLFY